jgi:Protein of unknown function (DUF2510)
VLRWRPVREGCRRVIWPSRLVSLAGAALTIAALFVTFAGDLKLLDVDSLFDSIDEFELQVGWVLPPLVSGFVAAILPLLARGRLLGAALIVIGAETVLFFLGYVLPARVEAFGGDRGFGAFLGIAGGACVLVAGCLAMRTVAPRPARTQPVEPEVVPVPSVAPAGWYPDPASEGLERFWDGAQWTNQTR